MACHTTIAQTIANTLTSAGIPVNVGGGYSYSTIRPARDIDPGAWRYACKWAALGVKARFTWPSLERGPSEVESDEFFIQDA